MYVYYFLICDVFLKLKPMCCAIFNIFNLKVRNVDTDWTATCCNWRVNCNFGLMLHAYDVDMVRLSAAVEHK